MIYLLQKLQGPQPVQQVHHVARGIQTAPGKAKTITSWTFADQRNSIIELQMSAVVKACLQRRQKWAITIH